MYGTTTLQTVVGELSQIRALAERLTTTTATALIGAISGTSAGLSASRDRERGAVEHDIVRFTHRAQAVPMQPVAVR